MTARISRLLALSALLLSFALASSAQTTFTVNSTSDIVDASPGDGSCDAGSGACTLRAAVQEADALNTPVNITLPAGLYKLSLFPACTYRLLGSAGAAFPENMKALCMTSKINIQGAGAGLTIIDGLATDGLTCCGSYFANRIMVVSQDADVTISGVTFQDGQGNGGFTFLGGGAISNQGKLALSDCEFLHNRSFSGGAIYNAATLSVVRSTFDSNASDAADGGAVNNTTGANATIAYSTFTNNTSVENAGGVSNFGGTVSISGSTFTTNQAQSAGGAIFNIDGPMTLVNSTVSNNLAFSAGAIWNQSNIFDANNVTVTLNHTRGGIGAVASNGTFHLRNSIVSGNLSAGATPDCSNDNGGITSKGHNIFGSVAGCGRLVLDPTDIVGRNPNLGALGLNGGITQTHALLSGSAAIDAGDPATPGSGSTSCSAIDQRGIFRPQGSRCDIGAFETSGAFSLSNITPSHAGNSGNYQGTIGGNSINSAATIALHRSGSTDIPASSVNVLPGNSAAAVVFSLSKAATGSWDVVVTNPDGSSKTLSSAFTVETAGSPAPYVELVGPVEIRPSHLSTPNLFRFSVVYGNRGNVEALAVPFTLSTETVTPLTLHFLTQNPPAVPGQVATDWTQAPKYVGDLTVGVVNVPFLLPVIPPGFSGSFSFTIAGPIVGTFDATKPIDIAALSGASLFTAGAPDPAQVAVLVAGAQDYAQTAYGVTVPASSALTAYALNQLNAVVQAGRSQLVNSGGETGAIFSLPQLVIDVARYGVYGIPSARFAPLRERTPRLVNASFKTSQPLNFIRPRALSRLVMQASGSSSAPKCNKGAVLEPGTSGCPDPDPDDAVPKKDDNQGLTPAECRAMPNHHVTIGGKYCAPDGHQPCGIVQNVFYSDPNCFRLPIRNSQDPNDKYGPPGYGPANFLAMLDAAHYEIEFENSPTATGAAQTVVVTDALDTAHLDLGTFSLGPMQFANRTITPPPGLTQFSSGFDLRPAQNLAVKITAGLDPASGIVTWKFLSLDPTTGQAVTDASAGFLPPDVTQPEGMGELYYNIQPKKGLASGTTICNQASIVFDANPAINTPAWCNTFDSVAPISKVSPLPATEAATTFNVAWSGTDTGSGVASYSIFFSDNGGPYSALLTNTTATSSSFTGVNGHTYAFYSLALDQLGNAEAAKKVADTTTSVKLTAACVADLSNSVAVTRSGFAYNPIKKIYTQTLTLKNTSATTITSGLDVVIDGLSSNAALLSPVGTTSCALPAGSPYVTVSGALAAGANASVVLQFSDPKLAAITYSTRVLAANGKP